MFDKLMPTLFATSILSIDLNAKNCSILWTLLYGGKIIKNEQQDFRASGGILPYEAVRFINNIKNKYSFTYIALLANTTQQGIIQSKVGINSLGLKPSKLYIVNYQESLCFIDKPSMNNQLSLYSRVNGVDYVFSPFAMLYETYKSLLGNAVCMCILLDEDTLSLLITKKDTIYLGKTLKEKADGTYEENIQTHSDDPHEAILEDISSSAFNNIETKEVLFDDILENFDKMMPEQDQEVDMLEELVSEEQILGELDKIKIRHINHSIKELTNEFYSNPNYGGSFIEKLYVATTEELTPQFVNYLRSELLFSIEINTFKITYLLTRLAILELQGTKGKK